MDYIRLLTGLSEHRKWMDTSGAAAKVLINLWCFCGRNETDGYITSAAARREGLTGRIATELEEREWIHKNGEGWYVHDWEEHQLSTERLAEMRRLARERKRRQRSDGHA